MMLTEKLILVFICCLIPLGVTGFDVQPSKVALVIDGTNSVSAARKLQMTSMADNIKNMLPSNSQLFVSYIGEQFTSTEVDLGNKTRHKKNVPENYGKSIDFDLLGTNLVINFPDTKNRRTAELFILLVYSITKPSGAIPDIFSKKKTLVVQFGLKKSKWWTALASNKDLDFLVKQPEDIHILEDSVKEKLANMSEYVCDTNMYALDWGPRSQVYIMCQCLSCENLCKLKAIPDVSEACLHECKYHPAFKTHQHTKPVLTTETPERTKTVKKFEIDREVMIISMVVVVVMLFCLFTGWCLCRYDVHKKCGQLFYNENEIIPNRQPINNTVAYQPADVPQEPNGDFVIQMDEDETTPMLPGDGVNDRDGVMNDESDPENEGNGADTENEGNGADAENEGNGADAENEGNGADAENEVNGANDENGVDGEHDEIEVEEDVGYVDDTDGGNVNSNHEDCLIKNPKQLQQNFDAIGNIPIYHARAAVVPEESVNDDTTGEMDVLLTHYGYRDRGMDVSIDDNGTGEGNVGTGEGNVDTDEGNVDTDEGNVDTDEGNVDTGEGTVDTDEGNVDTDEGNVDTDEGHVGTDEGHVGTDEGHVGTDEGLVGTDEGHIGTDERNVGTDEGHVDTDEGHVGTGEGNVGTDERNVDTDEGHVDTDEGIVDTDEGHVDTDEGHVGTGEGNVGTGEGNVDTDEGHVDTDEGNVDTDEGHVGTDEGHVDTDEGHVGTGEGNVDTDEGHVGTDEGHVGTDEGNVGTDEGNVGTDEGLVGTDEGHVGTDERIVDTDEGNVDTDERNVDTDEGHVGTDEGHVGTDEGHVGTDEGNVGTDEGHVGTDERNVGTDERNVDTGEGNVDTEGYPDDDIDGGHDNHKEQQNMDALDNIPVHPRG